MFQDFVRINNIDSQILSLHKHLAQLYEERQGLIEEEAFTTGVDSPVAIVETSMAHAIVSKDTTRELYDQQLAIWKNYGVSVPTYKTIKPALQAAEKIKQTLSEEAGSAGLLHILLVPPKSSVLRALSCPHALKLDMASLANFLPTSKSKWQVLVMFDPSQQILITDFASFLENRQYMIDGLDTRGLDILSLVAASLQNIQLVDQESWTCLLTKKTDASNAPCAILGEDDTIRFNLDDSGGILGQNFFNPAVSIST